MEIKRMNEAPEKTRIPKSRSAVFLRRLAGTRTATAVLLAVLATGMINYIAHSRFVRADWSREKYYQLSEKSRSLLESLKKEVEIIVFFQPGHELFEDIRLLLEEYRTASKKFRIEWVNPSRDLARTEELAKKYEIQTANVIVFTCEGRTKYVTDAEIAEYDFRDKLRKKDPELTEFTGEQAFSSAIHNVVQGKKPVVYYLTGHGERDFSDFDPITGYSSAAKLLDRENINLVPLRPGEAHQIPDDCALLIIAGPQRRFSEVETDQLNRFLNRGGRLLLLLDAQAETGLENLLNLWGVELRHDLVLDPERTVKGGGLLVHAFAEHPVTRRIRDYSITLLRPRAVRPTLVARLLSSPDRPQVTPLLLTSERGWSETQLDRIPMKFDENTGDLKGPVSMAVAVEKGGIAALDVQIRPARLVVVGDSGFFSNGALSGGAPDLFLSAVNWLLDREELLGIAPRPSRQIRLSLTRRELRRFLGLALCGPPGLLVLGGLIVWIRRRK